jgi:hypothetical protein
MVKCYKKINWVFRSGVLGRRAIFRPAFCMITSSRHLYPDIRYFTTVSYHSRHDCSISLRRVWLKQTLVGPEPQVRRGSYAHLTQAKQRFPYDTWMLHETPLTG